MSKPKKGLIVALDVESTARAKDVVRRLGRLVDFYKVAPSVYFQDPKIISWLRRRRKKVFLDFKWYDIPSQVQRSVRMAGRLGVTACTVHLSAGGAVLKAALGARPRPLIWGVTVLTSFAASDLREVGLKTNVPQQVLRLARLARNVKLDGLVCSPQELHWLRGKTRLTLVTPGIRWGPRAGHDQKRLATPREAWDQGADYIVLGRALLNSPRPTQTLRAILNGT